VGTTLARARRRLVEHYEALAGAAGGRMRPDDPELTDEAPVVGPDGHLTEGGAHAFVDGALGDEDAARAIAHVAACARCAGVVAEARGLTAASTRILSALDDVPAGVVPAVTTLPTTAPAAAAASAPPRPALVAVPGDRGAVAARRVRWSGWPVRAAAGVLLAVGLGSAVWRGQAASAPDAAASFGTARESEASTPFAAVLPAAPIAPADAGSCGGRDVRGPARRHRPGRDAPTSGGGSR
jgi:hypothetical protein